MARTCVSVTAGRADAGRGIDPGKRCWTAAWRKQIYYGAKCLVAHRDPYQDLDLWSVYRINGGTLPKFLPMAPHLRAILSQSTNLPFTFLVLVPFTFLPWAVASKVWVGAIAASFLLASYLVWTLSAPWSPGVSCGLLLLLLANSTLLLSTGNAAGLVVSFAVIATWAILRDRYALAGPILLALSLALKPHDSWLILIYFFLAGGVFRKRAWQTFAITVALTLLSFLWVWHLVPNWPHELHSNLASSAAPGGRDDPGPMTNGGRGVGMIISLQVITSLIRNEPRFYNPPVYLFCFVLLAVWGYGVWKSRTMPAQPWFALAAIAAFTMLPVYHRTYDAKLLLLTIPACAILWSEKGLIAWCALMLNLLAILFTGDTFLRIFFIFHHNSPKSLAEAAFLRPPVLVATGLLYLWAHLFHPISESAALGPVRSESSAGDSSLH
jgi:hypothetical protein